ncbi:hypothetical protein [Aequorivita viscosa]|uniref:Uncharacterized protein n=1 Tax=Aequorivita viscosa TaxID=797419 RepID=A0A1M6KD31_9FLAO|nr:hypothetical protein [Aequorivita viscosa]SDX21126.1 hypothetical protein SAMN05216556_12069 [Aequorivita viscosa]SHJ56856.1 hypothetical protein SAMN04487908_1204 [Aequorivita viscosa]
MSNKKLIDLFKSKGLLFPSNDEEIEEFENSENILNETPLDWDNPSDILKRGYLKLTNFNLENDAVSSDEIQNLSRAAREGKEISEKVSKKMLEDKNASKKK